MNLLSRSSVYILFRKTCIGVVLLLFFVAPFAHAQEYVPLVPIPGVTVGSEGSWETYLRVVYVLAISIAAMIAVIKIIYAGFLYIGTAGSSDKKRAKEEIRSALIGLFIILAAVLILRTINPAIVNLPALPELQIHTTFEVISSTELDDLEGSVCPSGYIQIIDTQNHSLRCVPENSPLLQEDYQIAPDNLEFLSLPLTRELGLDVWWQRLPDDMQPSEVLGYLETEYNEQTESLYLNSDTDTSMHPMAQTCRSTYPQDALYTCLQNIMTESCENISGAQTMIPVRQSGNDTVGFYCVDTFRPGYGRLVNLDEVDDSEIPR